MERTRLALPGSSVFLGLNVMLSSPSKSDPQHCKRRERDLLIFTSGDFTIAEKKIAGFSRIQSVDMCLILRHHERLTSSSYEKIPNGTHRTSSTVHERTRKNMPRKHGVAQKLLARPSQALGGTRHNQRVSRAQGCISMVSRHFRASLAGGHPLERGS